MSSASLFLSFALLLRLTFGAHLFLHKTAAYMLASQYLYEHFKRMSVYLLMANNLGIVTAVFFGNFLY